MKFIPHSNRPTRFLVTIDPDLNASGVASWSTKERIWLLAQKVSIENILSVLAGLPTDDTTIYVEAGWLIKKANLCAGNYRQAQAKAGNVGENHATGKMTCKIPRAAGYNVIEFKQLCKGAFKTLAGSRSEIGRRYVEKESGIGSRMNDDVRDAIYCDALPMILPAQGEVIEYYGLLIKPNYELNGFSPYYVYRCFWLWILYRYLYWASGGMISQTIDCPE